MTDGPFPSSRIAVAWRLTPPGQGGISIIALAGPQAAGILDRLTHNPRRRRVSDLPAGHLLYGQLRHHGEVLDEVLIECAQTAPTPCLLINCHGGAAAERRILSALTAEGAAQGQGPVPFDALRPQALADALQAEAAQLLPQAPTLRSTAILLDQWHGALSRETAAALAAAEQGDTPAAARRAERLVETAAFGRGLCDPPSVVLAGRPNVGKSSLGNALLRFDRMIVHPQPGVTRDAVEEMFSIEGIPFRLTDTAGVRETEDGIEREGVRRTMQALDRAALTLLVFDASEPLREEDRRLAGLVRTARALAALNKCDLPMRTSPAQVRELCGAVPVAVSAMSGAGLAELEARILSAIYPGLPAPGDAVVFTRRQEECLRRALGAPLRAERLADGLREMIGPIVGAGDSGLAAQERM